MTFGEINEDIIQVRSLVQFYFVDFRIKKVNWGPSRECTAVQYPPRTGYLFFFNQLSKQGIGKALLLFQMT